MSDFHFNIVLLAPDIPGNTGSIGRTCLALNLRLILIRPYGFDISEKAIRRAGLDYWKYVNVTEYDHFDQFLEKEEANVDQLHLFTKWGKKIYYQAHYEKNHYLIFGSETKGLPKDLLERFAERTLYLPTLTDKIRSLNLANAATAAAYEAYRHLSLEQATHLFAP